MSPSEFLQRHKMITNPKGVASDSLIEDIWMDMDSIYEKLFGEGIDLDATLIKVWERELQFPCWVYDGVAGTHPAGASQFTQASAHEKQTTTLNVLFKYIKF